MKIATWNVNGVRARIEAIVAWIKASNPDIVCLQETKVIDKEFPLSQVEDLGYHAVLYGQKMFHGVAILSKLPMQNITYGLPGIQDDNQARYIEAVISPHQQIESTNMYNRPICIASLYAPNGNPIGSEKFLYKLSWMQHLEKHAKSKLASGGMFVMAGDYNIIPSHRDAQNPASWEQDALYHKSSKAAFRRLIYLGFVDAIRAVTDSDQAFTFWNYKSDSWRKNNGIRIDHILLSPSAADNLNFVGIEDLVRSWNKPSDHVPLWADLNLASCLVPHINHRYCLSR